MWRPPSSLSLLRPAYLPAASILRRHAVYSPIICCISSGEKFEKSDGASCKSRMYCGIYSPWLSGSSPEIFCWHIRFRKSVITDCRLIDEQGGGREDNDFSKCCGSDFSPPKSAHKRPRGWRLTCISHCSSFRICAVLKVGQTEINLYNLKRGHRLISAYPSCTWSGSVAF